MCRRASGLINITTFVVGLLLQRIIMGNRIWETMIFDHCFSRVFAFSRRVSIIIYNADVVILRQWPNVLYFIITVRPRLLMTFFFFSFTVFTCAGTAADSPVSKSFGSIASISKRFKTIPGDLYVNREPFWLVFFYFFYRFPPRVYYY